MSEIIRGIDMAQKYFYVARSGDSYYVCKKQMTLRTGDFFNDKIDIIDDLCRHDWEEMTNIKLKELQHRIYMQR